MNGLLWVNFLINAMRKIDQIILTLFQFKKCYSSLISLLFLDLLPDDSHSGCRWRSQAWVKNAGMGKRFVKWWEALANFPKSTSLLNQLLLMCRHASTLPNGRRFLLTSFLLENQSHVYQPLTPCRASTRLSPLLDLPLLLLALPLVPSLTNLLL